MGYDINSELLACIDSLEQTADLLETVTAMLNRHGEASVLIDAGEKNVDPHMISSLFNTVLTRISPMVIPVLSLKEYNGMNMILIKAEGEDRPYCTDGRYMLRSGDTNIRIDTSQLDEHFPMRRKNTSAAEDVPLSLSQMKVFNAIKEDPQILTRDIAAVTGLKISRVNQLIRELKDAGKLYRIGSNKSGYWSLSE